MKLEEAQKHLNDYLHSRRSDVFAARIDWAREHPEYKEEDMHLAIEYIDTWTEHTADCACCCMPIDHAKDFRVKILDHNMWLEHAKVALPPREENDYYVACKTCGYLVLREGNNSCDKCGNFPFGGKSYRGKAYEQSVGFLQKQGESVVI